MPALPYGSGYTVQSSAGNRVTVLLRLPNWAKTSAFHAEVMEAEIRIQKVLDTLHERPL
jgi:hypothetical protein